MTLPSPAFKTNGGAVGAKASIAVGGAFTAELDDISGVRSVAWSVNSTDETTVATDWNSSFVTTGSIGQRVAGTAPAGKDGVALALKCEINGGIDPSTETASSAMHSVGKIYVPSASGLEPLTAGELAETRLESNTVAGAVEPINEAIRRARSGKVYSTTTTTVNNTPIVKLSADALANGKVAHVKLVALARDATTGDSASYEVTATFEATSGTTAIVGAQTAVHTAEQDAAWAADLVVSGNLISAKVTGDAANTTDWTLDMEVVLL